MTCPSDCNSSAAYMRHRRAGEMPCIVAKAAWRRYWSDYRKAKP